MTDRKTAAGITEPNPTIDDIITVTINVTDVDEDGTVSLSMTHPSARTQLTATLTDPDGGVTNESWQWAKADAQNDSYTNITGETSATYTPEDDDVGKWLKAKVSYDDDEDTGKTAEGVSANPVQTGANRAPTFDTAPITLTVPENSGADVDVGNPVTATDLDTDNTLTYTLEGTDKDSFKVISDGQIQTKSGVTYDFETKPSYSVTVKADDGNTGTATKAVTINLTNADDSGTVALSTTQPVARTQLTATLTDQDTPITGISWVWARSDAQDGAYNAITDATLATYTPTDGDVGKFLKATATYTDSYGSNKSAAAVTDNAVGAGTNRAPEFPDTSTTRAFPENLGPGLPIDVPVEATDADKNDVLIYTLEGTDKDSFEIVPNDGQIKTKVGETYNHEAKDSYSVTVKVDDQKGGTDTITVTINVTDVNEKPSFNATPPVAFNIAENSSANTNIGAAVGATDPDDGDTLVYSLDNGSAAIFNIDSSNGQLKTKAALDKETEDTYTVTVSVRDNRDASGDDDMENDASIEVTVNVTDVNEPPEFPSTETRTRNVQEGTAANQAIGNPVKAVDPDVGATLTYTLAGTDATSFNFDTSTGQLKTKVALNKETKDTYTVTVSVRDSKDANGNADTATDSTITVTINVTDTNEPPVLSGSATVDYEENGTGPVSTYTAVDPEGATIDWSLTGTDAAKFTIDGGGAGVQSVAGLRRLVEHGQDIFGNRGCNGQNQPRGTGSNSHHHRRKRPADFRRRHGQPRCR